MAEELADIQAQEGSGIVADAPIPEAPAAAPEKAAKPEKSDKSTLRQTLEKSVETVRDAEAKADKAGRLHAADGKFAKAEDKASPVEIPKTEKDAQPTAASKPDADGPPPGLSKETKALWPTLPPAVKADAVRREQEYAKGIAEKNEKLTRYQDLEQVLAPVRPIFQQNGISNDAAAIKSLLSWEAALRNPNTRMQAFQGLAQQYGINLNSPQNQAPEIPDQLRPVYDQFGQLSQTVNTLQGELQRSREEKVSETLAAFSKDKPHFEKVRVYMGQLIQSGASAPHDLEGAYQKAIWADPDIRAALIKEQSEKQAAELAKTAQARSQTARAAAISPSTRAPNGPVVNGADKGGKKSVRDTLMASVKELQEQRA